MSKKVLGFCITLCGSALAQGGGSLADGFGGPFGGFGNSGSATASGIGGHGGGGLAGEVLGSSVSIDSRSMTDSRNSAHGFNHPVSQDIQNPRRRLQREARGIRGEGGSAGGDNVPFNGRFAFAHHTPQFTLGLPQNHGYGQIQTFSLGQGAGHGQWQGQGQFQTLAFPGNPPQPMQPHNPMLGMEVGGPSTDPLLAEYAPPSPSEAPVFTATRGSPTGVAHHGHVIDSSYSYYAPTHSHRYVKPQAVGGWNAQTLGGYPAYGQAGWDMQTMAAMNAELRGFLNVNPHGNSRGTF